MKSDVAKFSLQIRLSGTLAEGSLPLLGDTMLEALNLARRNRQQEGAHLMIPAGLEVHWQGSCTPLQPG